MTAQAGWYVDPRDSTQYRYWDGERWSQSTQPIPSENAGLASGDTATGTLAAGGTADPIGAGAFGATGATADADASVGDAPADLMWTAGFGDDATSSRSGAEMFSPDQGADAASPSPWQPAEAATASSPVPPAPVPPAPVPAADQTAAQPSAFTPSAPESPSAGGPMFIRDTGSDPAFTPAAPEAPAAPGALGDDATVARSSKLDQYTMPAGQVPEDHPTTSKRPSRRKRAEAEDAGAVAAGAAAGATLAGGPDGAPRRRRKSAPDEMAATPSAKPSGPLPPGAKPVKSGQTSRLPLLLGVLGVVVVGAAAFLFLRGGDDEGGDVATDTPETTAAPAETSAPAATEPTAPVSTAPTTDPAMTAALEQAFAGEVTRACDSIKADPGQLTESVIQFDPQWEALGRTYEDLQRAVNECSQPARDEALRRVAEAAGGG